MNHEKILIVDDERPVREILRKLLDSKGYCCALASGAAEAHEYLKTQAVDLILCDIRMPGESGLDLIRQVAQKYPDTAVVMVTAVDDLDESKTALDAGVYGYIVKPFAPNQILISVVNALRRRELEMARRDHLKNLEKMIAERTAKLEETNLKLQQEITEHKLAKKTITASEQKYRFLINRIPGFVYKGYQDWSVDFVDNKVGELTGYDKEEFDSRRLKWSDLIYKEDLEDTKKLIKQATSEKDTYIREYRIKSKSGETLWTQDRGRIVRNEKGEIDYFTGVFFDITKQKQAEETLQQKECQLLRSEKMASIGQLAAGVAHEINNPTGFVSSNLKTLSDYIQDINGLSKEYRKLIAKLKQHSDPDGVLPHVSEQMKRITALQEEVDIDFLMKDIFELIEESREGTERIKKIVQDLKDFAHPGEDKPKFADINQNMESTLNVVWNELKYKAEVVKDYGDLPQVQCYPQLLNQVFVNLLVNAAQSIEDRGEIKIKTRANNGYVEIKISDTGCGVSKKNLPRIFDPFFTTKDVGKGTGLGLNVAYNIIKKHHGQIDVKSDVGKGTAFTIKIPSEQLGAEKEL
jgi:two-component system NtrC family sensor kinase